MFCRISMCFSWGSSSSLGHPLVHKPSLCLLSPQVLCVSLFFLTIFLTYLLFGLDLRCCEHFFSSCGDGGYSPLPCAGFSLRWLLLSPTTSSVVCGLQQLWLKGFSSCNSRTLEHRLRSCGAWVSLIHGMWGSSQTGDRTRVSCIGRWILYH